MFVASSMPAGSRADTPSRPFRLRWPTSRAGRIALALLVLNEIRGLCVVAAVLAAGWKASGH